MLMAVLLASSSNWWCVSPFAAPLAWPLATTDPLMSTSRFSPLRLGTANGFPESCTLTHPCVGPTHKTAWGMMHSLFACTKTGAKYQQKPLKDTNGLRGPLLLRIPMAVSKQVSPTKILIDVIGTKIFPPITIHGIHYCEDPPKKRNRPENHRRKASEKRPMIHIMCAFTNQQLVLQAISFQLNLLYQCSSTETSIVDPTKIEVGNWRCWGTGGWLLNQDIRNQRENQL